MKTNDMRDIATVLREVLQADAEKINGFAPNFTDAVLRLGASLLEIDPKEPLWHLREGIQQSGQKIAAAKTLSAHTHATALDEFAERLAVIFCDTFQGFAEAPFPGASCPRGNITDALFAVADAIRASGESRDTAIRDAAAVVALALHGRPHADERRERAQ